MMLSLSNWLSENKSSSLGCPTAALLTQSAGETLGCIKTHTHTLTQRPWICQTSVPYEEGQLLITRHSFRVCTESASALHFRTISKRNVKNTPWVARSAQTNRGPVNFPHKQSSEAEHLTRGTKCIVLLSLFSH